MSLKLYDIEHDADGNIIATRDAGTNVPGLAAGHSISANIDVPADYDASIYIIQSGGLVRSTTIVTAENVQESYKQGYAKFEELWSHVHLIADEEPADSNVAVIENYFRSASAALKNIYLDATKTGTFKLAAVDAGVSGPADLAATRHVDEHTALFSLLKDTAPPTGANLTTQAWLWVDSDGLLTELTAVVRYGSYDRTTSNLLRWSYTDSLPPLP